MLDNTLTFDYAGAPVTLDRVNQDNFASTYFGESGNDKIELSIKHTIPQRGGTGESHLVRFDVQHYDNEGTYLRSSSAWTVIKTFDGVQSSSASTDAVNGLMAIFGITDFTADVIGRQS